MIDTSICVVQLSPIPQTAKHSALTVLPAITCKMEAVRASLGYRKEKQVGVDRLLAGILIALGVEHFLGC